MKRKWMRVVPVALAAALLFSGCAGNGGGRTAESITEDPNVTAPGELPIVKDRIKLSVGVYSTNNIIDYKTNAYSKFLMDKTGIDLEFVEIVNPSQKLKIMLAADDELPELLLGMYMGKDLLVKYGKNGTGALIDLGEYMDNYGYYLNDCLSNSTLENLEKRLTTDDGGRYFMPSLAEQTGNQYCGKAFINKKWLDKLGLEVPKTTEDLRNVLSKFVNDDPNGNGKKDEIGLTGCTDGWYAVPWHFLVNSFVYDDISTQLVVDKDNKVSSIYYTEEFKNALAYINSLIKEGLYDENAFTQDRSALRQLCQGDDELVGCIVAADIDSYFANSVERIADWVPLPPLEGPKGVAYATKADYDVHVNGVMTKYCKNKLAAFRLMDYMLSEEASVFSRFGVEGTDWKPAGENDISLFGSIGAKPKIVPLLPYGSIQNSHWEARCPSFISRTISDGMAWNGSPYDGEKLKGDALGVYYGKEYEYRLPYRSYTLDEQEEMSFLLADINQHLRRELADFMMGRRSLDEYDTFLKELDGLDYAKYLKIVQSGVDRAASK